MTDTKQPRVSDLIFSSATDEIRRFHKESRRSALSITNRLQSISQDAQFAKAVSDHYRLPLVANERCGSWYIDPKDKIQSAYFKSTDGHAGQWSFSLRRLNLQVLETVADHGGCVVVDSTRRGKSMPDALSKTTPIWISVMNRFLFSDLRGSHELHTPKTVTPPSEHSQMEARLDGFVEQLKTLNLDVAHLKSIVKKPLLPVWVTQDLPLPDHCNTSDFYPVVLCTASRRVAGGEDSENGYIQGAADDHESWAHGLTPVFFWKNKEQLLATSEDDLPTLIASITHNAQAGPAQCILVKPTSQLYVTTINALTVSSDTAAVVITCSPQPPALPKNEKVRTIHLTCAPGKVGSRQLRHEISKILPTLDSALSDQSSRSAQRLIVACPSGKDHSIGTALAILCLYANDQGGLIPRGENARVMDKNYIKQRLSWISVSMPDANPSRTTLQSINAFLLG